MLTYDRITEAGENPLVARLFDNLKTLTIFEHHTTTFRSVVITDPVSNEPRWEIHYRNPDRADAILSLGAVVLENDSIVWGAPPQEFASFFAATRPDWIKLPVIFGQLILDQIMSRYLRPDILPDEQETRVRQYQAYQELANFPLTIEGFAVLAPPLAAQNLGWDIAIDALLLLTYVQTLSTEAIIGAERNTRFAEYQNSPGELVEDREPPKLQPCTRKGPL